MKRIIGSAAILVLALSLAGCEDEAVTAANEDATLTIGLDLVQLRRVEPAGLLQSCIDIIEEITLAVDGDIRARRTVAQGQRQVEFTSVEASAGQDVRVEVLSSNDTVLYDGAAAITSAILELGTLTLNLAKTSPVIRVCDDEVVLSFDGDRDVFAGTILVENIGTETLAFQPEGPAEVAFDPPDGSLEESESVQVEIIREAYVPEPFVIQVLSDPGSLEVIVSMVPVDAPLAVDDEASTAEDAAVEVDVLVNDEDPGGGSLTVSDVTQPENGTVEVANGGAFVVYTPDADFFGSDTFAYVVVNDRSITDTADVFVAVEGVNDAPAFTGGPDLQVDEDAGPQVVQNWANAISAGAPNEADQTLEFAVTANDNPDLFVEAPALSPEGTLTFTTAADAFGEANITAVLMDNGGTTNGGSDTSEPQSFVILVHEVNDPPLAAADTVTVDEDAADVPVDVLANDSDPDGDGIVLVGVQDPTFGSAAVRGEQVVYSAFFEPMLSESDEDAFTYVIEDTRGLQSEGTVAVRVNPCVDFDASIEPGTYDDGFAGLLFTENDLPVSLAEFVSTTGQSFFNFVDILAGPGGQLASFNNTTLVFDLTPFTELTNRAARYVHFGYEDQGGSVNLEINGVMNAVQDFEDVEALPEGISIEVQDGLVILRADPGTQIDAVRIGGQELLFDDVCVGEHEAD